MRLIKGATAEDRLAARRTTALPLMTDLETWMRRERGQLSRHAEVARAMDYLLNRCSAFTRFLKTAGSASRTMPPSGRAAASRSAAKS